MPRKKPASPARRPYGSGTVTRVDAHSWRAQLPRAVDPRRPSRRFPTRAEADVWLTQQIERYALGLGIDAGMVTLGEYADAWLENGGWDEDSARAYRVRRRHLDVIADVPLADLRPSHVERVLATMRKRRNRHDQPLSERFCRLVVGLLSSVLGAAIRDGILTRNVTASVRLPKLPQTEAVVLSEVEARRLLRASEGTRWHACWWVMLAVGLRSGEVRGLERADVDLERGSIRVRRSVKTPRRIGATKGRRERWVPIPPGCADAIRAHLELLRTDAALPLRGKRRGRPKVEQSPWLFPSHVTGRPYPSNTLRHNLLRALDAAGIDRIRPHDLRHSAASIMLAHRRPLPIVAEILGHRSSAVTAQTYAHILIGQHREVADVMGDVLGEPAEKTRKDADSG